MKHVLMMALAAGALLFTACGGTSGPTGATGATGATGPSGTNGTDGNANVKQYTFGTRTTSTGFILYSISPFTQAELDSSTIVMFHESVNVSQWVATPGYGLGSYSTRASFLILSGGLGITVALIAPAGTTYTTSTTFTRFRVIVIPASSNVNLAKAGGLNLNDYNAVRKYYNLPE